MNKPLLVILLSLSLISVAPAEGYAQDLSGADGALDRESLIEAVLQRNPSLEAARHALTAASEREIQAGALDDPMLMVAVAPLSIGGSERFGARVEARQRLPFAGKRRARTDLARSMTAVGRHELDSLRRELALAASLLYDDYYLVERSLEITRDHIRLLEDMKASAEAQYIVGRAAQQDPLQAEVELTHLMHQEVSLEGDRREIVSRLNQLLRRRPGEELPPPPPDLKIEAIRIPEREHLQALAMEQRPELAGAAARLQAERAEAELARLDFYPDLELMASYDSMWMSTEHQVMAGVGVNLPVWREKRRAAVREAEAETARALSEIARIEDEIAGEVERAWIDVTEMHHILELYSDRLLPAARDQVEAAHSGFTSSRNSFVAVVEAERNLRTVELRYQEAVTTLIGSVARLERAAGFEPFALMREMIR